MSVDVDDSWPDAPCSVQRQLQEVLGSNQIPVGRQHEIDGISGRIDGSIQVHPASGYPNVRFVHPPGSIRMPSFAPKPVI
jgi:hypothetical protein